MIFIADGYHVIYRDMKFQVMIALVLLTDLEDLFGDQTISYSTFHIDSGLGIAFLKLILLVVVLPITNNRFVEEESTNPGLHVRRMEPCVIMLIKKYSQTAPNNI